MLHKCGGCGVYSTGAKKSSNKGVVFCAIKVRAEVLGERERGNFERVRESLRG